MPHPPASLLNERGVALLFLCYFYFFCKVYPNKVIYALKLRNLLPLSSGEGWGEAIFWEEFVPV